MQLTEPEFAHSKIVIVWAMNKERISFKNDNMIVEGASGETKLSVSCYKIFTVFVIGGTSITTGLIERSKRFGFSIVLFSAGFRLYQTINYETMGNTLLREKQYKTPQSIYIARKIIENKLSNQIEVLKKIREDNADGIEIIRGHLGALAEAEDISTIMGHEGVAAKTYFNRIFNIGDWKGRTPRLKRDPINLLLDIGYTVLFNYVEALLNLYGFDVFKGNLHQEFYKRKSLVCDMVEPFRPIIDYTTRKMLNLNQVSPKEWVRTHDGRILLNWQDSAKIVATYVQEISKYRQSMFRFIQGYYRWFMKNAIEIKTEMPKGELYENDFD